MNNKQKIIDALKGEFRVIKIRRIDFAGHPAVRIYFEKEGKNGDCYYTLYGEDSGIEECNYAEDEKDDIYEDINDWFEDKIHYKLEIKCNGKDVEWE